MKYLISILSLVLITSFCGAQLVQKPFSGDFMTTDNLGNFYFVKDGEIKKFDQEGRLWFTFSDNRFGSIYSVDASDPHKVLVFYNDMSVVLTLDNTLSINSDIIELQDIPIYNSTLTCHSYNNTFWVYDEVNFSLSRMDYNMETLNHTGNLSVLLNQPIKPNFLVEYNNKVYLNNPESGILVFDRFGTYIKTIPLMGLKEFQVKENFIVYCSDEQQVFIYDFMDLESKEYLSEKLNNVSSVRMENEKIYSINDSGQFFINKIEY